MPCLIGIDEAGYGPNLGPLVMTAVACRAPAAAAAQGGGKLWQALRGAVRRPAQADDGRLCVGDSKQIFSQARGLAELERAVLALLRGCTRFKSAFGACHPNWSIDILLQELSPAGRSELSQEPWYQGTTLLPLAPVAAPAAAPGATQGEPSTDDAAPTTHHSRFRNDEAGDRFHRVSAARGISWGWVGSAIVCARRFNGLVERWGSKAAVLGLAMSDLMRACWNHDGGDEPVAFVIDKHGGRNHYSALLQHALEEGMVLAREEGARRSHYEVIGLPRPVTITFQPRADAGHFCVALASMVSKYVREVLMHEFNRFWQSHLPELEPTAGYPGDAQRFFDAIRPLLPRLQIAEEALWRQR